MKPVNLTPTGANLSTAAAAARPSGSTVIFGVVGVVLVVALGGYFAFARVSTIKSEAVTLAAQQATSDADNQQVVAQLAELGQKPSTLSWESVAVAYMKDVTDKAAARTNFPRFLSDMSTVLPSGAWFQSVDAGLVDPAAAAAALNSPGAATSDDVAVNIEGYATSLRDVNTIVSNLNALSTIDGAELSTIDEQRANNGKSYRHFTITAKLLGTSTMSADGALVDNGGVDGLALEPQPVTKTPVTPKKPTAPPDPLVGLVRDTGRAGGAN